MIIRKEELHKYDLGKDLNDLFGMSVGEAIYIKETLNKLKRINEDEYMFQRFDSITTHLVEFKSSSEDSMNVWKDFTSTRDYSMKYAQDRCNAINNIFNTEAATNIVSSKKFMVEQNKATTKPLSGESGFTKTLEKIADFIVYAKFDNEEEDIKHEEMKKEAQRLKLIKKKKRKEKEEIRLARLKEEVKDTPSSKTRRLKQAPKHYQVTSLERVIQEDGGLVCSNLSKVNFQRVDRQMQQGKFDASMEAFWERFSPSKTNDVPHYHNEPLSYKEMAYSTMLQYIKEVDYIESLSFTPERAKQLSWLKGEMRTALDILRKVITVQPSISVEETIPHDSWDRLSLRDTDTYIALLFGYNEACKKYNDKPSTTYWALLRDFEELLQKTEWSKEEAVIIEYILETGNTELKDIQIELEIVLDVQISHQTLSNWLNKIIPSKIHSTNEKQLEDWVWTYRRKGKYKACSKCKEVKLAVDDRYFRKHPKGKLGLQSKCKACEKQ
ncbi:hypothetical protein [Mammaliicoccus sciuri]|uniref:hypothetical protein n=1 Tax=Mammaliicoccus sciuri TaxID=1296 RepID=UPI0021D098AB|nr:hypothetical protein [Mammaliicoccus sciuri]UXU70112.1 hypothetical protein MUA36_05385 [Mammaliicoccus sciuri]